MPTYADPGPARAGNGEAETIAVLQQYKALLDQGVITEAEFEAKKNNSSGYKPGFFLTQNGRSKTCRFCFVRYDLRLRHGKAQRAGLDFDREAVFVDDLAVQRKRKAVGRLDLHLFGAAVNDNVAHILSVEVLTVCVGL